jgi:hypothetical protein
MTEIDFQALASRTIVYRIDGMDRVTVRRDVTYRAADGTMQAIDLYTPPDAAPDVRLPAVVIVTGYPDAGVKRIFGRYARDFGTNVGWARLIAASGLAAITYVNVDPAADAAAVIRHLQEQAPSLGIDDRRIAIWSCSGNVPNALSLVMGSHPPVCAALLYGYMLDMDGLTAVHDNARFGYVTPAAEKTVNDMPPDLPVFIARAGLDEMPGLNQTIDAFATRAIDRNLPMTIANHPSGPHAFDAVDDSNATRQMIRQILVFLTGQLLGHTVA